MAITHAAGCPCQRIHLHENAIGLRERGKGEREFPHHNQFTRYRPMAHTGTPLLDSHTELVYPTDMHVWESALEKQRLPYLNDHRIQGIIAVPISVYIEMIQAAAAEAFGQRPYVLKEIELKKLLLLPEEGAQKVQVVLSTSADTQDTQHLSFHVYSHATGVPEQPRDSWTLHVSGQICTEGLNSSRHLKISINLKSIAATMLAHLFESHPSNDASASSKAQDG